MIVGKDNYNEIIAGIYASEDKKTLVLDVFNLIGLDRSMTDEVIADELNKRIGADPLKDYCDTVENIVFNCGEYLILKPKRISVDVEKLRIAFTKLRAIACGSEIQLPNVLPIGIRVVDNYIIDDLACQAEEGGLKEKAEFYYRWEPVLDYYWGNYHLGQFLQKNNQAEFEECYKKIAGENDWFGNATSEYGVWLHKQGRYSEAIKYLMYATRALVDTSSREYALGTLCTSVLYDDCPYWKYFDETNFIKYLIYYLECDSTRDNSDIEKVLLQRASSEDSSIAQSAQEKRAQLVTNGSFMIDDGENGAIDILDYVKMKEAKEIFSKEIEDSNDVELILSRAYSMFNGELDEKTASLLENLLLSVECDEELCSFESEDGVGLSKVVLFWLYYDGRYEIENEGCLEAPSLLNKQKAAEILKYEFILRIDINPILMEFNGEDDFNNILESAYALYPEKDMIVRNLVEKCAVKHDVDKLVDIITQASEKLASYIALDLFGNWDYFFEYEDEEYTSENIEKILIALSEKGVHREFLLSLYQFGSAKIINLFGEYEVVLPTLKSEKKASAFSNKHNVKPLSAPLEVVAAEENVTETKSIVEQKKEALINAVIKAWDDPFCDWELEESEDNPNVLVLGTKTPKTGFVFFMAGCRDLYGGIIWVEYEPEEDLVGIYIKDRAVQPQFKEDIVNLFEKYAPFNMKVSFEGESTPIISRKEKVEPQDFVKFFEDFRAAYDKYYPLFYMVTVSAIKWYDGFYIAGADC